MSPTTRTGTTPASVASSSRTSGRRIGLAVIVFPSLVVAWLGGWALRSFEIHFQLEGSHTTRGDYLYGAGIAFGTAAVLGVGLAAVVAVRGPAWLTAVGGLGAVSQVALGVIAYRDASGLRPHGTDVGSLPDGLRAAVELPTAWPLLLVVVIGIAVALATTTRRTLTTRSPREPRPRPDRSAGSGRRRST